jgi:hypothetical protein
LDQIGEPLSVIGPIEDRPIEQLEEPGDSCTGDLDWFTLAA